MSESKKARRVGDPLSLREAEVWRLVASDLSNKQIAQKLGIGEVTVKTHVHRLFEKLGANGRVGVALAYVRKHGFPEPREAPSG